MRKLRILVFPCGSEIGLEIHRSLSYSTHVELFGASSVNDHGKFVFANYIDNIPFVDDPNFVTTLTDVVKHYKIDAIYPTMDKVIWKLKLHEEELGCVVVTSPADTTEICLSKSHTYQKFCHLLRTPITFNNVAAIQNYPVFVKPDIGYGSRDVFKADTKEDIECFFLKHSYADYVISEYLSGDEYTVDCFTDRNRELRFCGPRLRQRINNGISVNTVPSNQNYAEFFNIARTINHTLNMRGAWFFQVKRDNKGDLTLLEIAARLGGSSSLYRGKGVNFALLSIFDAFDVDIEIATNNYKIELDRALDNKYKIDIEYSTVYVDFDDCIFLNGRVNTQLIKFLYKALNDGERIILISKHDGDLIEKLKRYRILSIFDEIYHIGKDENKYEYIDDKKGIFIDDSFQERSLIQKRFGMFVFSPDMIEILI